MEKVRNLLGNMFLVVSFLFLLVSSLVVVSDGLVKKDLFGFIIPESPKDILIMPYLGPMIGFVFEFASLHGLFTISIFSVIAWLGILIKTKKEKITKNSTSFGEGLDKRMEQVSVRSLIVKSLEEVKSEDNLDQNKKTSH